MKLLRKLTFFILRISCLHVIIREFFQRNKVTIVYFHEIPENNAEKIFLYYQKKFNIIALKDYVSYLHDKTSIKIPDKALIVTIDDGLKQNFKLFNIISKLDIPITIFLVSGIVATNKGYWWNHNKTPYLTEDLKNFEDEKRLTFLEGYGFKEDKPLEDPESLSQQEINIMKTKVDFQSHSVSHPILTKCNSKKSKKEIFKSKDDLQSNFNLDIYAFAFPNGNS